MADNVVKEILQYVIDTAQMEAGGQRAKKIEQDIADARKAGQDTGGLETKLASETAAHEKLTQKTGESRVSLEKLLKSKRDMGDVVSLLGGRFQGLIGDVGGVIELFTHLGRAAVPIVGALAAITAAVAAFGAIAAHTREVAEAMERMEKAKRGMRDQAQDEGAKLYDELAAAGVSLGTADSDAALQRMQQGGRNPIRPLTRDFLRSREVARALAAKYGGAADDQSLNRALAVSNGKIPTMGDDEAANEQAFKEFLERGAQPGADTMFENMAAAHREQALRESLLGAPFDRGLARRDTMIDDLVRRGAGDQQVNRIKRYLDHPDELSRDRRRQQEESLYGQFGGYGFSDEERQAIQDAEAIGREMQTARARVPGGITVNVNTTNNGTVYSGGVGNPFMDPHNDLASGGSPGSGQSSRH